MKKKRSQGLKEFTLAVGKGVGEGEVGWASPGIGAGSTGRNGPPGDWLGQQSGRRTCKQVEAPGVRWCLARQGPLAPAATNRLEILSLSLTLQSL